MKHQLDPIADKVSFDFAEKVAPSIARGMASTYTSKKRAYEALNTTFRKTGVLDMSRIANYKTSDDIFITKTWKPEGKSHGLYFVMDWSGSMKDVVQQMAIQYYITALFCKYSNIPFRFDIFTSGNESTLVRDTKELKYLKQQTIAHDGMSIEELKNVFFLMICFSNINSRWKSNNYTSELITMLNRVFWMGNTPLYKSMYATYIAATNFRAQQNLQNVSIVYITDGEAHAAMDNAEGNTGTHIVCPFTQRRYVIRRTEKDFRGYAKVTYRAMLGMNEMIRDAGFKIFNIFIGRERPASNIIRNAHRTPTLFNEYTKDVAKEVKEYFECVQLGGGLSAVKDGGNFNSFIIAPHSVFGSFVRNGSSGSDNATSAEFVKGLKSSKKLSVICSYVVSELCKDFAPVKKV